MSHRFKVLLCLAAVLCTFWSPAPAPSQDTTFIPSPATSCVLGIYKYFYPSQTSPTFVSVVKFLSPMVSCSLLGSNSASCYSYSIFFFPSLVASASGTEIGNNPSCSWLCPGCGTITIDSASDGLPVELMDFSVE